jgi:lysophospholipase L1-like esterase
MKLHALLIGINEYPSNPLNQCVNDVSKFENYLKTLNTGFDSINIVALTNQEATKSNIQSAITENLGTAEGEDTVLIYYSGHGALESSSGLFPDEHDGALECMVCYPEDGLGTGNLLADKEIRYLLHKIPNDPHIVTIFDACHSGDMVRAYSEKGIPGEAVKRLSGFFPERAFEDFIFSEDDDIQFVSPNGIEVRIPFKNSIHLGACLSSESSWEDSKGGVFTRYLLQLLKATNGNLTYLDITRWAKLSIKNVTRKKQTPLITVQGYGKVDQHSSWLNLHPEGVEFPSGVITNNTQTGWLYSKGQLLGVKPGMEVQMKLEGDKTVNVKVREADLEYSILDIPMDIIQELDFSKQYEGSTVVSTYNQLALYINDIDHNQMAVDQIEEILGSNDRVSLSDEGSADFFINIFNEMVYFSMPDAPFQPLSKQIDLMGISDIKPILGNQLRAFIKWNHFYTLENPGKDYLNSPILVEARLEGDEWQDVTNSNFSFDPYEDRLTIGEMYRRYEMRTTNITDEVIFLGVLTLTSNMSITSKPYGQMVVELQPHGSLGDSKVFYDHKNSKAGISFDTYKEIYNWKEEWFYYKFVFNNYEDFTPSLQDNSILQEGLRSPLFIDNVTKTFPITRGEGAFEELEERKRKWGTCMTRIEMRNPTYNIISGNLKESLDEYMNSEELAPFIKELYFEDYWNGEKFEIRLKPNKTQSSDAAFKATDVWIVQKLNKIYNNIRRRRFKRNKHQTGPVVVAEGDSWFLFPKPGVKDTLDYIMHKYRLLSLADAGDDVADYIKNNELIEKVDEIKPDYVLISGGGNDVLGSEIKSILKNNVTNGVLPEDFVKGDKFQEKMDFLDESYRMFFSKIKTAVPDVDIFVHGYDYIPGDREKKVIEKGWANKYMIEAGIKDPAIRDMVIHYLVDTFNNILEGFEQEFDFVHYVNNRNTVELDEWMDEIHPNNTGYKKVADNFLRKMDLN